MNNEQKIWTRGDFLTGLATGLLAFAVYAWTVAPNVTLLDCGEFATAAINFGVPHPTGYPLWTLLAWLFSRLPLGNKIWEVNLFSSVCAGLAVGICASLTRSTLRWLLGESLSKWSGLTTTISATCSLLFAFSFSMWSQATITEVYALHALMIGAYLTALYAWLRKPDCLWILLLVFFLLALAFSNHQLTLSMPWLTLLAVLLVRPQMFWDLVVASMVTAMLAYLGFAILSTIGAPHSLEPFSTDRLLLKTAIRFSYFVAFCVLLLVVFRRMKNRKVEWRLIAFLPYVVALGLLPYLYMPLASSTNPPMNWSYTRTPAGFFYSFNRSQYDSPFSEVSLRTLGRFLGTIPATASDKPKDDGGPDDQKKSLFSRIQEWAGFFWLQLGQSFTLFGVLGYFGAIFVIFRLGDVQRRTWVYVLEVGFVLAVFLQPILEKATIDSAGWWQQMPYHTYTNLFFAQLIAVGFAFGATALFERAPRLARMRFALVLLPLVPLFLNYDGCSQKDRWFGWQFGYDMLKDLPKDSIVLGGTDPGRFVPTYMILGESGQAPQFKRDPKFDRRDLYIITQNGVGEPLYRKYIADHYGPNRPEPQNAFERWLGRTDAYPKSPLLFPTDTEIHAAIEKEMNSPSGPSGEPPDRALGHSVVTRLIWEKNRDKHEFFVEESFPLKWSYDYAIPHGLVYQINKEPLKEIPADVVEKDFAFWKKYIGDLLANPNFNKDYDAKHSFSKLRTTTGNIYLHRKMNKEAERAYREALSLWKANPESLLQLTNMLWVRLDFDGVQAIIEPAMAEDPNNEQFLRVWVFNEKRKEIQDGINALQESLIRQPRSRDTVQNLLKLFASVGETNKASDLLEKSISAFQDDPDFLRAASAYAEGNKFKKQQLAAASRLAGIEAKNPDNFFVLARAAFFNNDKQAFYPAAQEAIKSGGVAMREAFERESLFAPWKNDTEFQSLTNGPTAPPKPAESPTPSPPDKK